jgi:hypothetical protein
MSPVRGLGEVLPSASLMSELRPISQTARESQLRGVTAEALSRDPAGCAEVQKQANVKQLAIVRVTSGCERLSNSSCSKPGQVIQSAANVLPCLSKRDARRCVVLSVVRLLV